MDLQPGLLRLPRELRDEVYYYIFSDRKAPPNGPNDVGSRVSEGTLRFEDEHNRCPWFSTSLSRTCRQLRCETRDYISRHRTLSTDLKAELDLMFNHFTSYPTWLYVPPDITREAPHDLKVNIRIFSVYTFERYDRIANSDGWNLGEMSAPFLDLLLLLKRFVRFGPFFNKPWHTHDSNTIEDNIASNNVVTHFYRIHTLSVNVTFHNNTSNKGNASNILKCLRNLARCGLSRRFIHVIKVHISCTDYYERRIDLDRAFNVWHDVDEARVRSAIRRGFCHTASETLGDGPLENREAVKIAAEDLECG